MVILILGIVCFVVAVKAKIDWNDGLETCALLAGLVCFFVALCGTNSSGDDYNKAKKEQLKIATEWTNSAQTEEDWQWVCEQMAEANEIAKKDHYGNKVWYAIGDTVYVLGGYKRNLEMYTVTITENEIIFPDEYNKLPLRKREENKVCQ